MHQAHASESPNHLPATQPTIPCLHPCGLCGQHLALAQSKQGGDQGALPSPTIWPLGLGRQVAVQGLGPTVLPIQLGSLGRSDAMEMVLVRMAG